MNLVRSRRSSSLTLATKGRKPSTISPRLSRIVFSDMGETHSGGDTLRLVIEDGAPLAVAPVSRKEGETGKCEMPVGRRLLSEMDLTNALVCSDALHCQHETVRTVARSNGESLVQIKDNQKGLLRNARAVVRARFPVASKKKQSRDTGGGRLG